MGPYERPGTSPTSRRGIRRENCLSHDPASEEAASALMHIYAASGRQALVATTYERARAALEELGLRASPALENARRTTIGIGASAFGAETTTQLPSCGRQVL